MEAQKFIVGDVVQLLSGAEPKMTIREVSPTTNAVLCVWYDGPDMYHRLLHQGMVNLVTPAPRTQESCPLSRGPVPTEAFRLKLMEVAAARSSTSDDFMKVYVDLLRTARRSLELGSLAFLSDQDIVRRGDIPHKQSTLYSAHQDEVPGPIDQPIPADSSGRSPLEAGKCSASPAENQPSDSPPAL